MPSGGARAGAGRKSRFEKYCPEITNAERSIADQLPKLIDKAFELANGIQVQETNKDGTTSVYSRPPDRQAIEYLVNRVMGKPVESVELSGPDGESLNGFTVQDVTGAIFDALAPFPPARLAVASALKRMIDVGNRTADDAARPELTDGTVGDAAGSVATGSAEV